MFSKLLHVVACDRISFPFKTGFILLYVYTTFCYVVYTYTIYIYIYISMLSIDPLMDIWSVLTSQLLWIVLPRVCRYLFETLLSIFGILKCKIAGSCGIYIFNFLRNCPTASHSSCIILRSHQQSTRVSILLPTLVIFRVFFL